MTPKPPITLLPRYAVFAVTVIVCVVIGACTALVLTGHSLGDLMAIVSVIAVPVVGGLLVAINERQRSTDEKVNGRITQIMEHNRELTRQLSEIAARAPAPETSKPQAATDKPDDQAQWRDTL